MKVIISEGERSDTLLSHSTEQDVSEPSQCKLPDRR